MRKQHKLLIISLLLLVCGWLGIGFGYGSRGLGAFLQALMFYGGIIAILGGIIVFILGVKSND